MIELPDEGMALSSLLLTELLCELYVAPKVAVLARWWSGIGGRGARPLMGESALV